jgi:hypothetical protein
LGPAPALPRIDAGIEKGGDWIGADTAMSASETWVQLPWQLTLQLLAHAKVSGLVSICSGNRRARMVLIEGRVLHATSSTTTRLGESLVDRGVVTGPVLDRVLQMQRRKKKKQPLGTILMELGLVSKAVAEAEIETQIARVLKEVTSWERCKLKLEPMETSAEAVLFPESCDLEALLARLAWARED